MRSKRRQRVQPSLPYGCPVCGGWPWVRIGRGGRQRRRVRMGHGRNAPVVSIRLYWPGEVVRGRRGTYAHCPHPSHDRDVLSNIDRIKGNPRRRR